MMRCIAIDDEPLALAQITGYISKTPFLELKAPCSNAIEAIEFLSQNDVELLFVDINMPGLNGLDFVRSLTKKPFVIFTTAYSEYAIDGFRVDAIDYLLKPIGYPDFLHSAEKALRQYKLLQAEKSAEPFYPENIFVKSDYKTVQIAIDKITHIESRSEYLRIYLDSAPAVMTLGNMKSIEESLPVNKFMRVHRSHIVNLQKIASIDRNSIIIGKDHRIPVGEQYKDDFQKYVNSHLFAKK